MHYSWVMGNVQTRSEIVDGRAAFGQETDSALDVTPRSSSEGKYTASLVLFTVLLFLTPFLFGGRSDLSVSVIRAVFLLFFLVRAVFLTISQARSSRVGYFRVLKFFPYPRANRYFMYCVPLLLFVGVQMLALPYSVLNVLSPFSAEAYVQTGAFDADGSGFGYISLDPLATRNGFLWILVFGILGAELLSLEVHTYMYSSHRHSRKKRHRSSMPTEFAESSRAFDFYSEFFLSSLIYLSLACSLVAIFHLASGSEQLFGMFAPDVNFQGHSRAHYPFVSPNHLAVVLEIGLMLSFVKILRDRQLRGLSIEPREDETLMRRVVRTIGQWENQAKEVVAFVVLLLGLFLTGSRAGITISLSAITVLWMYYKLFPVVVLGSRVRRSYSSSKRFGRSQNRFNWLPALVFPLVLVFVAFFFMGDRSRNQLASRMETGIQEGLDIGRKQLQGISLEVFSENPLWGVGLNAWKQSAPKFANETLAPWELDYAHNEYLQFLAELGLIGSALLVCPLFYLFGRVCRAVKETDLPEVMSTTQKFYLSGLFLCFLVPFLHAWVDFPLHMPAVSFSMLCSFVLFSRALIFYLKR